jgi:hypothetical protein
MTVAALPPQALFEILQSHPATCRANLVCWNLTKPEAVRVLRELQDAQRARQGAIVISGKSESGWVYSLRSTAGPGSARPGVAGLGEAWHGEPGQGKGLAGPGESSGPAAIIPARAPADDDRGAGVTTSTAFAAVFGVGYGGFVLWFAWQMFVAWPREERGWAQQARDERDAINRALYARHDESRRLEFPDRHPDALRRAWRP